MSPGAPCQQREDCCKPAASLVMHSAAPQTFLLHAPCCRCSSVVTYGPLLQSSNATRDKSNALQGLAHAFSLTVGSGSQRHNAGAVPQPFYYQVCSRLRLSLRRSAQTQEGEMCTAPATKQKFVINMHEAYLRNLAPDTKYW